MKFCMMPTPNITLVLAYHFTYLKWGLNYSVSINILLALVRASVLSSRNEYACLWENWTNIKHHSLFPLWNCLLVLARSFTAMNNLWHIITLHGYMSLFCQTMPNTRNRNSVSKYDCSSNLKMSNNIMIYFFWFTKFWFR